MRSATWTRVVRVIGARTYHTYYAYDKAGNVDGDHAALRPHLTTDHDSLARVTA